jgi:uncharacterized damage-inducible protein DinB
MAGPVWLQGPIAGVPPLLQPVAHALIEADEDVQQLLSNFPADRLWNRPNGAASVGYHIKHCMGSLDRLLTYARGDALDDVQLATLQSEKTMHDAPTEKPSDLAAEFAVAVDGALAQLRATRESDLLSAREVGRAKAPSTVIGLLAHAAEHTYRHVGQAITTARIVSGSGMS